MSILPRCDTIRSLKARHCSGLHYFNWVIPNSCEKLEESRVAEIVMPLPLQAKQHHATVSEQLDSGKQLDWSAALSLIFKVGGFTVDYWAGSVQDAAAAGEKDIACRVMAGLVLPP